MRMSLAEEGFGRAPEESRDGLPHCALCEFEEDLRRDFWGGSTEEKRRPLNGVVVLL